jgi:hypothetical protein
MICLPYYLRFFTLLVLFIGGWVGYEMAGFAFSDGLFSMHLYSVSSFAGSMWFMPFFLLMVFLFYPWVLDIGLQGFLILVEWNILVVRLCTGFFLILVGLISDFSIIV